MFEWKFLDLNRRKQHLTRDVTQPLQRAPWKVVLNFPHRKNDFGFRNNKYFILHASAT